MWGGGREKVLSPSSLSQASYGVEDAEYAVVQLAQTTMRSELGKIRLDSVFQERMNLNHSIVGEWVCSLVWVGVVFDWPCPLPHPQFRGYQYSCGGMGDKVSSLRDQGHTVAGESQGSYADAG